MFSFAAKINFARQSRIISQTIRFLFLLLVVDCAAPNEIIFRKKKVEKVGREAKTSSSNFNSLTVTAMTTSATINLTSILCFCLYRIFAFFHRLHFHFFPLLQNYEYFRRFNLLIGSRIVNKTNAKLPHRVYWVADGFTLPIHNSYVRCRLKATKTQTEQAWQLEKLEIR